MGGIVFPTHVGMNRTSTSASWNSRRIPHARGDEPNTAAILDGQKEYSPRTWG